jgi:3',5'-cyclic AMP phosphodiesterase CpdA
MLMPLAMFKLAHISDVHLGPLPRLTIGELLSKRITGFINWHRNRRKHMFTNALDMILEDIDRQAPDHLAITGDLVNLGTGFEVRAVARWLDTVGNPKDVSVVPGNHDAYVRGSIKKAIAAWKPYLTGDDGAISGVEPDQPFPYIRRRGPIALIGCSTSIATPPFSATGYFGPGQARETARLLKQAGDEGLFRVVMIHHPPIRGAAASHKRMFGIRRFKAAVSVGGAELVLHGHTHLDTINWIKTSKGDIPVVGIASASQGPGGKKPPAAYNLFEISGEPGNWNLSLERHALTEDGESIALDMRKDF